MQTGSNSWVLSVKIIHTTRPCETFALINQSRLFARLNYFEFNRLGLPTQLSFKGDLLVGDGDLLARIMMRSAVSGDANAPADFSTLIMFFDGRGVLAFAVSVQASILHNGFLAVVVTTCGDAKIFSLEHLQHLHCNRFHVVVSQNDLGHFLLLVFVDLVLI